MNEPQIVFVKVPHNFVDLTGKKFGKLTVLRYVGSKNRKTRWGCMCECGRDTVVVYQHLVIGHTKSCGCLHTAMLRARATHGQRHAPEYASWAHIIQRCTNKNNISWPDYGGRGIKICDEWRHDFAAFYKHIGPKPTPLHTVERIDNDGHYTPGNVCWATKAEQNRNRRKIFGRSLRRRA